MPGRVATLVHERRQLERELSDAKKKLAMGRRQERGATEASHCRRHRADGAPGGGHRPEGPAQPRRRGQRSKVGSGVVAIVGVTGDGKAGIVVGVTQRSGQARYSAVDLVRKGAEALGGKGGGGRPDMAQAGGPDGSKADAALAAIEAALGG